MLITAYPLAWPPTSQRTPSSKRASATYRAGFAKARDDLLDELRLFGADNVVISSDIPLRKDGLPYASFKEPSDPGIGVYFRIKGQSYVICCDAWDRAKDNLRAIGEYISALRVIRNCRVSSIAPIVFKHKIEDYVLQRPDVRSEPKRKRSTGSSKSDKSKSRSQKKTQSSQQPQAPKQSTTLTWREVLGVACDVDFATVRAAYYACAKIYHPDSGTLPDSERMKAVNIAFEQAKLEYVR
ncbi:J domain-containing protein [Nostoc sp. JL23]|uniref:J domain-containing protein n=1 Tax=Nostoc sp. JL23 TaxID=2815394 RepID=UPI001D9B76AE|nr:J domain-containing protein [Nostoc sp. JL23]MBN3875282.1 J domain-containing protein [Nostoc sp. JL23]